MLLWDNDNLNNTPTGKDLQGSISTFKKDLFLKTFWPYVSYSSYAFFSPLLKTPNLPCKMETFLKHIHRFSSSKTASIWTQQAMNFINLTMGQHFWKNTLSRIFRDGIQGFKQLNFASTGQRQEYGGDLPPHSAFPACIWPIRCHTVERDSFSLVSCSLKHSFCVTYFNLLSNILLNERNISVTSGLSLWNVSI